MSAGRYQFKRIELLNSDAFRAAERLQAKGWRVYHIGVSAILLEKKK